MAKKSDTLSSYIVYGHDGQQIGASDGSPWVPQILDAGVLCFMDGEGRPSSLYAAGSWRNFERIDEPPFEG